MAVRRSAAPPVSVRRNWRSGVWSRRTHAARSEKNSAALANPRHLADAADVGELVQLLFQIITEQEERASIAIGTNLPFSEWGTVFPDPRLVAIVDRITFNAHIIETGTQSYRLATSKTSNRKRAS
jgi:hypothetical protein